MLGLNLKLSEVSALKLAFVIITYLALIEKADLYLLSLCCFSLLTILNKIIKIFINNFL